MSLSGRAWTRGMKWKKGNMALCALVVLCVLLCVRTGEAGGAEGGGRNKNRVMPWLCLQRCNQTLAEVKANVASLKAHLDVFDAASFEMFNLGANGTLVYNSDLYDVMQDLAPLGIKTYAMISSYPYPPQFLDWMRQVFAAPQPFIAKCVAAMHTHGFHGFNVDWEPTSSHATDADAVEYANFLNAFADGIHAAGGEVTVDVGGWSPIWNWTLLASTRVDRIINMATYTGAWDTWERVFQRSLEQIGVDRLGVGLQNVDPRTNAPLNDTQIALRMGAIVEHGCTEIDLWRFPFADNWWPALEKYVGM